MERRKRSQQTYRPWQEEAFEDEPYYDMEPVEEEPYREPVSEIIATNRTVLLTCTLAAMMPPFALFLLFAEKKSRAIRHFSLQSVALSVCNLVLALALVLINAIFGVIPYLGFLMNLVGWIVYICCAIMMLVVRIRMMTFAWRSVRFALPFIGRWVERFNR